MSVTVGRQGQAGVKQEAAQRDAELIMLYSGGATLDEIGRAVGLTRERVRQRIRRGGYVGRRQLGHEVDPIAVCRAAETAPNIAAVADSLGLSRNSARRVLVALGKWAEFKERNHHRRRAYRRSQLISYMQHLAKRLDRTPGQRDLNSRSRRGRPWHMDYVNYFGSLTAGQRAAGLVPNRSGRCGIPQAEAATMRELYLNGQTINAIAVRMGRQWATVHRAVTHNSDTAAAQ